MALTDIVSHASLKNGLLAYYKMDGSVRDSWNANHGAAEKAVTTALGKIGKAIAFDGNGEPPDVVGTCQVINLDQLIAGLGSFSFGFWANLSNISAFQCPISLASWTGSAFESGSRTLFQTNNSTSATWFRYWGASAFLDSEVATFSYSTWEHWAFTVDYASGTGVTTIKVYKNGALIDTKSGSIGGPVTSTRPLLFGGMAYNTTQRLQQVSGKLDEFAVASRAWTASEVADLYNSGSGLPLRMPSSTLTDILSHQTLTQDLVAYWPLNGNAGDNYLNHDGTLLNSPTSQAGKIGLDYLFNGASSQGISVANHADFNTATFTVAAWVKNTGGSGFRMIYQKAGASVQFRLFIHDSGTYRFTVEKVGGGPPWFDAVGPSATLDTWFHLVGIFTGSYVKIYVNGAFYHEIAFSGDQYFCTNPVMIGREEGGSNAFTGEIDEVGHWSRVLTSSEVADLYNSGYGLPLERFPSVRSHPNLKNNIAAYWTLDSDGSDYGANKLPLTISGTPSFTAGKLRGGMHLTASGQKATRADSTLFRLNGNQRTYSCWIYAHSVPSSGQQVRIWGQSYDVGCGTLVVTNPGSGAKLQFATRIHPSWWPGCIDGPVISANTWYHVVVVLKRIDGSWSRSRMWVNGVEYSSTGDIPTSFFDSNLILGDVYIGAQGSDGGERFDGIIDEVIFWNATKSDADIADLYNSGMGLPWDGAFTCISDHPTLPSGMIAHWPFDGNVNEVQGRFNGVQSGSPSWGLGKDNLCIVQSLDAQYVDFGNSALLNPQKMSVAFWAIPYGTGDTNYFIGRQDGGARVWAFTRLGYNPLRFAVLREAGDESYASLSVNLDVWNFLVGTYDGTDIKLSKNLDAPAVTNFPGTIKTQSQKVWLGRQYKNFAAIDGMSIWDRAITNLERTHLYGYGNGLPYNVPTTDILSSATLRSGLVSYWKLDADANDCVGSHHGTLENSPSNVTAKLRKGYLLAKASSQAISIPHHADFNVQTFSYSIWYKPSSIDSVAPGMIIAKRNYDAGRHMFCYQHLQSTTPGTYFSVWTSGGSFDVAGTQPTVGVWRHAVLVCTGTEIKLYENGQLKGTTAITGTVNSIIDDLTLGRLSGSSNFSRFDGTIDEPAFWNRALSGDEVLQLYNQGAGITYDGTFTCISDHPSLTNGMIAGYPLGDVFDVGPNAFHGTLENAPLLVPGKIRNCYRLNGSNQVINLGSDLKLAPTLGITVACWAKIEGAAARQWQQPVSRFYYGWNSPVGESGNCYGIQYDYSSKLWSWWCGNGSVSGNVNVTQNTEGVWAFLVGTWDGYLVRFYINGVEVRYPATLTGPLNQVAGLLTLIGSRMGDGNLPPQGRYDYMNGKVDEVYFWDRALIQSEILNLYSSGAGLPWTVLPTYTTILDHPTLKNGLIAHYAFENNVNDSQTNFNGTAVGTPTYETGKIGSKAIRLNGSSQYVDLGADTRLNPGCITVAGWVKFNNFGTTGSYPGIVGRRDTGSWSYTFGGADGLRLSWAVTTSGGMDYVEVTYSTPAVWHFVVATYDGSYLRISVDGEEVVSKKHSYEGRIAYVGSYSAMVGRTVGYSSGYLNGWMDGVAIWDRAITESEIRALYNNGNGLPFGTFTPAASIAEHRSLKHGLVSFHKFDNSLLDNFCANDVSMGQGTPSYNTGKFPGTQAIEFSGAAGSFARAAYGASHNHRYLGFAGWVWLDSIAGTQEIVCKRSTGLGISVWDFYGGGNWTLGIDIGDYVNLTRTESAGQWHFFCGYFDGRTIFLRINERTATGTKTGWLPTDTNRDAIKLQFGAADSGDNNGSYRFDGRVCCVGVWDRPLMPSEITDLWNGGSGLPLGTISAPTDITTHLTMKEDLVGHWSLQADATEDSGNKINGTLVSSPSFQAGKVGNAIRLAQPHTHEHVWFDPDKFDPHFNCSRFSLGVWVYLFEHPKYENNTDARYSAIVAKSAYDGYDWIQFHLLHWSVSDGSSIEIYCRDSNNNYKGVSVAGLAVLNTWMYLTAVYDGKEIAFFKNGVCVGKAAFTSGVRMINFPLRFGFRGNGRAMNNIIIPDSMMGCSKKDLDQFAFASRAWTYKEVADLYNRGSGLPYLAPAGVAPNVASASATGNTTIRITFDKEVKHSSGSGQYDSLNPANYEFAGDVEITATDVDLVSASPTVVDVTVDGEMTLGESYLVTVSNVQDLEDRNLIEDTASFLGYGTQPQVASSQVLTSRKIRIVFDSLMTHNGALTDPGSYTFDGGLTAASGITAVDEGGVTKVEVPFTGTVTHGTTYHCVVTLVVDLANNVIDPDHDTVTFAGLSPRVSSAALIAGKIRVTFNSEMKHSDDEDPNDALYMAGYSVDGPTDLTITGVTLVDHVPTIVDLTFTGEMTDGEEYTVTATCQHITGSPLDVDEGTFTGSGVIPQLAGVDFILPDTLVFVFDKFMKEDAALVNPENYSIPVGPTQLTVTNPVVANTVDYTTVRTTLLGTIRKNGAYTASVIGVTDTADNPIDLEHNSAEFVGQVPGVFRAPVWLSPPGAKIFGAVEAPGTQIQETDEES